MPFFNESVILNEHTENDKFCYIKAAGVLHPDPSYSITRDKSTTVVFAYVLSGTMRLETRDSSYTLSQGDCYVAPSGIYTKVSSDFQNPHSMIWVNSCGTLIEGLYKIYFDNQKPVVARCNIYPQLKLIDEILKARDYESQKDRISLIIHEIFIILKNAQRVEIDYEALHENALDERIARYIVTHIQEKFDAEKLSKKFFISSSKLKEIFRKNFSCTPYQYYQDKRLSIAKTMLSETEMSIDEIAVKLNFVDRNHFSKFFRSKEGVSPAVYRSRK